MKRIRKENIFIFIFISLAFLLLLGINDINLFKSRAEENLQQRVQYQLKDAELFENEADIMQTNEMEEYTVSGKIEWWDDRYQNGAIKSEEDAINALHPMFNVLLKIINENTKAVLNSTYTNFLGEYTLTFSLENENDPLALCITTESQYAMVVQGNARIYTVQQSINYEDFNGSKNQQINIQFDMTNRVGQAFQVLQAINIGGYYAEKMNSVALSRAIVYYPHQSVTEGYERGEHCFFSRPSTINITGILVTPAVLGNGWLEIQPYAAWDVILHEYGHYVQYCMEITDSPGGKHYLLENCIELDRWESAPKTNGIKLAWGEAYPTVFADLAQKYCLEEFYDAQMERYILDSIRFIANGEYDKYGSAGDINLEGYTAHSALGEGGEVSIMRVLYDLYDDIGENGLDLIAWGHQEFWDIITSSKATTFSEFATYLYENNKVDFSNFGKLIGKQTIGATDIQIIQSYNSIMKMTWGSSSGAEGYDYNKFIIIVSDYLGNQIIRKQISNASIWNLTVEESNQIVYADGETYSVSIIAYQIDDEITTGGYYSETLVVQKDNRSIMVGSRYYSTSKYIEVNKTLMPSQSLEYYVFMDVAGWRIIQTFGINDTIIEFCSSNGGLIKTNDDSGYNSNAFIKCYVQANTEYMIRVKLANSIKAGTVKVGVFSGYTYKKSEAEALNAYDDFFMGAASGILGNTFTLKASAKQNNMCAFRYTTGASGVYEITIESPFDVYLYIIDPRKTSLLSAGTEYVDFGIETKLTCTLEANVEYLVVYSQSDITAGFENLDEGDELKIKFKRVI